VQVIGFLDARAQQLERTAKDAVDKYLQHQAELENAKVDTAKKSKMLEDMLRFEKEKAEQNEAQFKQEKKLLITEVKKLRTQTLALQGEADDAKKQLRELRRSIAGK
jgi:esterase/lipase